MKNLLKNLAKKNGTLTKIYGDLVNKKIRRRYSLSEELALIRQQTEKPDEYAQYCAYAEQCKEEARQELAM